MTPEERRGLPLSIMVRDGALMIIIGVETLRTVAERGPMWPTVKVKDADAFALALANEIDHDEAEDGRTPLMRVLDTGIVHLVEDAHESLDYDETRTGDDV